MPGATDENRIQSIDDHGKVSHYGYDDAGQRVIKQSRQNLTVYVNQYFTERNGSIGSKHIFVGNSRIVTKVTGGTSFIRSYDGVTDAKTPPGQEKKSDNPQEKSNNGKALGKDKNTEKTNNGKALGKDKEKNNNGKSPGKDKNTKAKTKGNFKQGSHPGQGVDNRSDRANEVAMNTCKNKHLIEEHCDEDGNGIPDSQEDGSDGGIEDGTIGDNTDGTEEEIVTLGSNGEQLFYYHPDHLGSTGYVTRENGEVHEHIQYFPFGETWVQQGGNTEKSPYLFTGKELDEETGLYYFGARYYDPRTSVWQSADPILEKYLPSGNNERDAQLPGMGGVFNPINLGLYTYTHNNPVRYTDPDGNAICGGACVIGGIITLGRIVVPKLLQHFAKKHGPGMVAGAATAGTIALNEGQSDNAGNESGRKIGDIDIPADATPDDARDILTDAGYPPVGNTQDESTGTDESGTFHEVDVKGNKTRVRVMDGKGNNGPRISVNSANNPKQPVNPTTGKPFKGNLPKQKQREQSHIPLRPSSSE
ncbi:RHS repeat domain-containing protein [Thiohalomonas denitrificans]|uniref:RHS repeat domain-containing protein n=1 Tax=Thiohalomonas denitrificans TaxID=415747 RepID=UPI0026ED0A1D|nr:RHS repeat-associated core domain-containing protein [Thiohalomonas denitrificans]